MSYTQYETRITSATVTTSKESETLKVIKNKKGIKTSSRPFLLGVQNHHFWVPHVGSQGDPPGIPVGTLAKGNARDSERLVSNIYLFLKKSVLFG